MALVDYQFVFSAGATIIASEHNTNFSTLYTLVNGNLNNANVASSAGIVASKLNLSSIAQNISMAGDLTLTGTANDFSGATISDLGTVTTADINGGTIDGTNIGVSTQGTGHVSTLKVGTTNQGDILYDNGTSLVRLTPGTADYFLQTKGAGANPVWAENTPAAGSSGFQMGAYSSGHGGTITWAAEQFDIGSDTTTTTFTAPVTGYYLLTFGMTMALASPSTDKSLIGSIVTTARTYSKTIRGDYNSASELTLDMQICVVADMTASDTAHVTTSSSAGSGITYSNEHFSGIRIG